MRSNTGTGERWTGVGLGAIAGGLVCALFGSSIIPLYGTLMGIFVGPLIGAIVGAFIPWRISLGILVGGFGSLSILLVWLSIATFQARQESFELPVGQSSPEPDMFLTLAIPALALIGAAVGAAIMGHRAPSRERSFDGIVVAVPLFVLATLGLLWDKEMADTADRYRQRSAMPSPSASPTPSPNQLARIAAMNVQMRYLDGHLFDAQYPDADPARAYTDPQTGEPVFTTQTTDAPATVLGYYRDVCDATNVWEYKGQNAWDVQLGHRDPALRVLIFPTRNGAGTTINVYPSGQGKTGAASITDSMIRSRAEREGEAHSRIPAIRAALLASGSSFAYPGGVFAQGDDDNSLFLRCRTADSPEQVAAFYNRIAVTPIVPTTLRDGATVWRGDIGRSASPIHLTLRRKGTGADAMTFMIFY